MLLLPLFVTICGMMEIKMIDNKLIPLLKFLLQTSAKVVFHISNVVIVLLDSLANIKGEDSLPP